MDRTYRCAACGAPNETWIDPGGGDRQEFVEDCRVCCRPMVVAARWNALTGEYELEVYQEDRD
ncbi:MAG: CPXCG motif-containing cysteine-rich protein [Candidatus Krumholzibacteriia bacterium]